MARPALSFVIPAKAGTQSPKRFGRETLGPGFRRGDGEGL